MWDVIIIGAGIGGLTSGAILAKSGKKVLVLESRSRVGGRATSFEKQGVLIDHGAHIFIVNGHIMRILGWLGSNVDFLTYGDQAALYEGGQFFNVPNWIKDCAKFNYLSKSDREELIEFLQTSAGMSADEIDEYNSVSVRDWVNSHISSEKLKMFLYFVANIYFTQDDPSLISQAEVFRSTKHAVKNEAWYCYPKKGGSLAVSMALADAITRNGGQVRTSVNVRQIEIHQGRAEGVIAESKDGLMREKASTVIFTLPVVQLGQMIRLDLFPTPFLHHLASLERMLESWPITSIGVTVISSQPIHQMPVGYITVPPWARENAYGPRASRTIWAPSILTDVSAKGMHYCAYGNIINRPYSRMLQNLPPVYQNEIARMKEEIWSLFPNFDRSSVVQTSDGIANWVDSSMKFPGNSWQQRVDVEAPGISGLYFAGDMIRGWGVAMDSAASSAVICSERILKTRLNLCAPI